MEFVTLAEAGEPSGIRKIDASSERITYNPKMSQGSTFLSCPICGAHAAEDVWQDDVWQLVRCADCSVVYLANPPNEEEFAALYSFESGFHTELLDQSAAIEDADRTAQQHLAELAKIVTGGSLLDIGCSTGRFVAAAKQAGFEAQGVELNPDTAEIARGSGLNVTTGTLADVQAEQRSFDAITMWDIVEHVPDPIGVLSRARELLSDEGWLWLTTPNIDGLFPQTSLRVANTVGKWPHPEPPYHLTQFSAQTITDALQRSGFDQVVIKHQCIPLSYSFGSAMKMLTDPRRLAYAAAFAPLAFFGPHVHRGDTLMVAAKPGPAEVGAIDLRKQEPVADLTESATTPHLEMPGSPSRSLQQ